MVKTMIKAITMETKREQGVLWLNKYDKELIAFENLMDYHIMDRDIDIIYKEGMRDNSGALAVIQNPETHRIEKFILILPKTNLDEFLPGISKAIFRIITKAHEFGHYVDAVDNYWGNGLAFYMEQEIVKEVNAWQLAFDFLDILGFDKFGAFGWRYARNESIRALSTYYEADLAYEQYDDEEDYHNEPVEARKERMERAKKIAQEKIDEMLVKLGKKFSDEEVEYIEA